MDLRAEIKISENVLSLFGALYGYWQEVLSNNVFTMWSYLSEHPDILSIGIFLLITSNNWPFIGPFLIYVSNSVKMNKRIL